MKSIILEKSIKLSIKIINLYKILVNNKEYVISKQLLRSSTSIGANISEAKYAESTKDFIHKFHIALKEANETLYWITILEKSNIIIHDYQTYKEDITEIIKILTKIIKTAKTKSPPQ